MEHSAYWKLVQGGSICTWNQHGGMYAIRHSEGSDYPWHLEWESDDNITGSGHPFDSQEALAKHIEARKLHAPNNWRVSQMELGI